MAPASAPLLTRRAAASGLLALSACGGGGGGSPNYPAVSTTIAALPAGFTQTKFWDFRTATTASTLAGSWPEWQSIGKDVGPTDHPPSNIPGVSDQIGFRAGALQLKGERWGKLGVCPNTRTKIQAWLCGGIETQGRFTQQQGFFEARFRWDVMTGARPAFWMLYSNPALPGETFPVGGEIDFFEYFGLYPGGYSSAIHKAQGGASGPDITNNSLRTVPATGWAGGDYHNYGFAWDAAGFTAYMDGVAVGAVAPGVRGDQYPFNRPFYLILDIIGDYDSTLDGLIPTGRTPLLEVEWVRAARR